MLSGLGIRLHCVAVGRLPGFASHQDFARVFFLKPHLDNLCCGACPGLGRSESALPKLASERTEPKPTAHDPGVEEGNGLLKWEEWCTGGTPMLPCFQLLRIGGGRGGDLYTFHPPSKSGCTYRLGCRADLCDVALRPQQEPGLISGVHAELHAELQGDDWRVSLEDHSSQGTLVNNVRLPRGHRLELSDGDLLTFGPEGQAGTSSSEFYFMFQQVRVKPQDFAAITVPRSKGKTGAGFQPMLPPQGAPQRPLSTLSSAPKATLILNSIGSLSKLQPQPLTFSRGGGRQQSLAVPTQPGEVGASPAPPTRNRRKSAHKVLAELDDESEASPGHLSVLMEPRKKLRLEKTALISSGE